jgi:hypothetical protein
MKPNMGMVDRSIRTLAAAVIAVLYFTGRLSGTLGTILLIMAVVFAGTSLISWCPAYLPFGLSTRKRTSDSTGG